MRPKLAILAAAMGALQVTGCIPVLKAPAPPVAPPISRTFSAEETLQREFHAAYDALRPSDALAEKVVMIDPGHFASSPGVVSTVGGGVREMDVNLTVAHHLAGLLRQQGATVVLTREGPRTAVPTDTAGQPLVSDLKWRADLANTFEPDLFISIHHNSRADSSYNATEIYYDFPLWAPNRARAYAERLGSRFAKWLGHPVTLMPANYYILRNTLVPAILGEASYLSHAPTASEYDRNSRLMREAFAYYEAAHAYLREPFPEIVSVSAAVRNQDLLVDFAAQAGGAEGAGVGRAFVSILPEGIYREFPIQWSSGALSHSLVFKPDTPLRGGEHSALLEVVDAQGFPSQVARAVFQVGAGSDASPVLEPPLVLVRAARGDEAMNEMLLEGFADEFPRHAGTFRLRILPPDIAASDTLTLRETILRGPALFLDLEATREASRRRLRVGHYPGSASGTKLAKLVQAAAAREVGEEMIEIGDDIYYLTIQTGMPAVRVRIFGEPRLVWVQNLPGSMVDAIADYFSKR